MGVISRGIKNAFRNTIRTVSITFILALSIAMSLVMLLALKTVQAKITSVKSSIGNTITVSPAGVRGFEGGGTLLSTQNATDVSALPHVAKVTKVLNDRLTSTDTNLVSAIQPGSFGNRQRTRSGNSNTNQNQQNQAPANFTMPVEVTATSDFSVVSSLGISSLNFTSGAAFDANTTDNVALVGKDLATKNTLSLNSIFTAYGTTVKVVGIYDTGTTFTNSALIMPIATLQKLSSQTDQYNSFIVATDSIDNVDSVSSAITNKLGSSTVDVVSQKDSSDQAVQPLQNIKTISLYSLIGSLVAGSIIIFLTMIMIVRERRREIGVLKAIGSSNIRIVFQFISESMVLTLLSSVIGMILGFIFSNPVLNVLVANSENSSSTGGGGQFSGGGAGGGGFVMSRIGGGLNSARGALQNIHAVVGWEIILYGVLAAIAIAIIGSAIPSFFIAKVRPAEVMRAE